MSTFVKRAATIAGGIVGLVVAFFLVQFVLHFSGQLAILLAALLVVGILAGCVRLAAWAWWAWKSPRVLYESEHKQIRVVVSREGQWTALGKPTLPAGLQALTYHADAQIVPALPAPAEASERLPMLVQPPLARTLLAQGAVGGGEELLLGFDAEGRPIRRSWKQIKAVLILGLQGGGKTTTACWLLVQVILGGGRLALIDKHARSEEDSLYAKLRPLQGCFTCPVGDAPASALEVVRFVRSVFDARLAGAPLSYPLLLVVDEFSAIMRQGGTDGPWATVAETLAALLEDLNFEGRKHQCYAICIGQAANASRSGGTEVRDTFNTRIVHAMREKQAQMLSLTEQKQQIARLAAGQVYIDIEGPEEPFFAQIPYLTESDLQFVATHLRLPAPQTKVQAEAASPLPPVPPLPYKPGATPLPVAGEVAAPSLSPPLSPAPAPLKLVPKALTAEERERERILAAHEENPDLSASGIASLLHISNNKVPLIKRIIAEAGAQRAQAKDA
jgi:hypothetical protein